MKTCLQKLVFCLRIFSIRQVFMGCSLMGIGAAADSP